MELNHFDIQVCWEFAFILLCGKEYCEKKRQRNNLENFFKYVGLKQNNINFSYYLSLLTLLITLKIQKTRQAIIVNVHSSS